MQVWICTKDTPQLTFVVTPHTYDDDLLIGFHLFPSMGYMYSVHIFLCTQETITRITNNIQDYIHMNPTHTLDTMYDTHPKPDGNKSAGWP